MDIFSFVFPRICQTTFLLVFQLSFNISCIQECNEVRFRVAESQTTMLWYKNIGLSGKWNELHFWTWVSQKCHLTFWRKSSFRSVFRSEIAVRLPFSGKLVLTGDPLTLLGKYYNAPISLKRLLKFWHKSRNKGILNVKIDLTDYHLQEN